jgi:NAD(P)H dehydrogenase (quinone)
MSKSTVLVMGVTGQVGKLVATSLCGYDSVNIRVTSRRKDELSQLQKEYGESVYLDLDEPRSFAEALKDVDSIFLLTGYTVNMLVQSKAIIDTARREGINHLVHLGVFSPEADCYDAHFAWHQMIEAYTKISGLNYTFLHPNCFLQNFTGFYRMIKDGKASFYAGGKAVGWIALEDVGEATAKILAEGEKHYGKDYWFSTEVATLTELVNAFNEITGKALLADDKSPSQFLRDFAPTGINIDPYFLGVADSFAQILDGRMDYIGTVRDDVPILLGRPGMSIRHWAELHKEELAALSN